MLQESQSQSKKSLKHTITEDEYLDNGFEEEHNDDIEEEVWTMEWTFWCINTYVNKLSADISNMYLCNMETWITWNHW